MQSQSELIELDLDPLVFIPTCEAAIQKENIVYLQQIMMLFYQKESGLVTAERVVLGLCLLDIIDHFPKIIPNSNRFKEKLQQYLCVVLNAPVLIKEYREQTKALIKVDPYFTSLINLPDHLSPPYVGEERKLFIRRRAAEQVEARSKEKILCLVAERFKNEALPKAAITFFHQGPARAWQNAWSHQKDQALSEKTRWRKRLYQQYEPTYKKIKSDKKARQIFSKLQYLDHTERDLFRVFAYQGKLYEASWDDEAEQLIVQPAWTETYSSHGKEGMAAFVINARGELFISAHIENEFNHASFMSGSWVLFAGEIKINEQGEVEEVTAYSGHYQPDLKAMYRCYQFLKKQGVNLSSCIFSLLDIEQNQAGFKLACRKNPALAYEGPESDEVKTKITNESMERLDEKEFLERVQKELHEGNEVETRLSTSPRKFK